MTRRAADSRVEPPARRGPGPAAVLALLAFVGLAAGCDSGRGTSPAPVRISASKQAYGSGELVTFTIVNDSTEPIYYRRGCSIPTLSWVEGVTRVALTTQTDDALPDLALLRPGEAHSCQWDQKVWQDATRTGRERFQHFAELRLVPAGEYELELDYWRDASGGERGDEALSARSSPFSVQ